MALVVLIIQQKVIRIKIIWQVRDLKSNKISNMKKRNKKHNKIDKQTLLVMIIQGLVLLI